MFHIGNLCQALGWFPRKPSLEQQFCPFAILLLFDAWLQPSLPADNVFLHTGQSCIKPYWYRTSVTSFPNYTFCVGRHTGIANALKSATALPLTTATVNYTAFISRPFLQVMSTHQWQQPSMTRIWEQINCPGLTRESCYQVILFHDYNHVKHQISLTQPFISYLYPKQTNRCVAYWHNILCY